MPTVPIPFGVLDSRYVNTGGDTMTGALSLPNTGLHILDTNASHDLIIAPGSDISADRTLTLTTGDADRTITLTGNPMLDNWFDQAVKQASSPTFANLVITSTGEIRPSANATNAINIAQADGTDFVSFDTSSKRVGIGTASPGRVLTLSGVNANYATCPTLRLITAADAYPQAELVAYGHDTVILLLDAYYDSGWKSSDDGSNFALIKSSDKFCIWYDSGITAGNTLTWNTTGFVLDTTGKVGINITPTTMLHVKSSSADVTIYEFASSATSGAGASTFVLKNNNSTVNNYGAIVNRNSGDGYTGSIEFININHNVTGSATGDLRVVLNNAGSYGERFRITGAGNVGINTTGPDRKLDVLDASNPQLRLTHTDGSVYTDFQTITGGKLTITPSGAVVHVAGDVGIGTSTPGSTLPNSFTNNAGSNFMEIRSDSDNSTYDAGLFLRRGHTDYDVGLDLWTDSSAGHSYIDNRYNNAALGIIFRARTAGTPVEVARMLGSGNVGIGTTGPDRKLDVLDTSNPQIRLTYTDGSVYVDLQGESDGDLSIEPSGSNINIIDKNILLGTTTGTQIGTAADQKIGFFGATPRVQCAKASFNNWAALSDVVNALVALGLFDQA